MSEMIRKDKEITDVNLISEIIKNSHVCRLGLSKDNNPYIVPVSFGFNEDEIYFHTAKKGKKIDYINSNNKVCFEFECGVKVMPGTNSACEWTFSFQSVIGYGKIYELKEKKQKAEGLMRIIEQYSDKKWEYNDKNLNLIRVWKIVIEKISGKQSKDKCET